MKLTHLRIVAAFAALGCAGVAHATPPSCGETGRDPSRPPIDHERARAALTRGEVLPLRRVLEAVERQTPGDILRVELAPTEAGPLIYKIKILTRDGRVVKQCLDARTAALLPACPEH